MDYIYDANGNKLAVKQGGTMKNVYCGDFVYNTSLAVDYILTPNGQLTRNPSTGAYTAQYNITDHLGNVRSVVNSGSTVLQSTDYYPFGLAFSDANITNNRYLYNGKELEDYTIGTSYLGTLDYGARHYDPRIARWTVPDPMAEKYYDLSSYQYCGNNSISYRDPIGMDWKTNEDRKTAAHLQNKASVLDKRLERREQSLEKKIARIKGNPNNSNNTTNKLEKYENQLSLIQFERSMLCSFSADVTRLGESKTTYTFNTVESSTLATLSSLEDGTIVINNYGSLGNLAHETAHAIQHDKGLISFVNLGSNTALLSNYVRLEIEAYRIEYSFSRGKVPYSDAGQPRSLSEINQTWLYGIFDPISGKYIYRRENYK